MVLGAAVLSRLHSSGMPVLWALADPKIGEREVLAAMLEVDAELVRRRQGLLLITDKGFASTTFEQSLSEDGITLLRPSRKTEALRAGEPMLKKVRQLIESVNDTLKGSLTSNNTVDGPSRASPSGSHSASSPSRQRSGTTTRPGKQPSAHSQPSITERRRSFRNRSSSSAGRPPWCTTPP